MHYEFKIDQFEGPLDLLLHLIKQSNIDIYDINLEEITNQYLDYIKAMEELNLDIASEYLVMAAELIEIKSRALLPKKEIEEDVYEEDPKEELINRLVEYKKYKDLTNSFKELESIRSEIYTKLPSNIDEYLEGKTLKNTNNLTVDDLLNAFNKFLSRKELEKPLKTTVTTKELSVTERIRGIRNILREKKKISFNELFEERTKNYIVVTFLSILEMVKNNEVIVTQENNFENIIISLNEGEQI
jgi:segregation and condensation protein A